MYVHPIGVSVTYVVLWLTKLTGHDTLDKYFKLQVLCVDGRGIHWKLCSTQS